MLLGRLPAPVSVQGRPATCGSDDALPMRERPVCTHDLRTALPALHPQTTRSGAFGDTQHLRFSGKRDFCCHAGHPAPDTEQSSRSASSVPPAVGSHTATAASLPRRPESDKSSSPFGYRLACGARMRIREETRMTEREIFAQRHDAIVHPLPDVTPSMFVPVSFPDCEGSVAAGEPSPRNEEPQQADLEPNAVASSNSESTWADTHSEQSPPTKPRYRRQARRIFNHRQPRAFSLVLSEQGGSRMLVRDPDTGFLLPPGHSQFFCKIPRPDQSRQSTRNRRRPAACLCGGHQ